MELVPGVIADRTAVFLPAISTLVLSDLHLGYEEELRRKGVFIPTGEFARVEALIDSLLSIYKPKTVVLNGDIKHGFGTINSTEWRHTRQIIERMRMKARIILVEGNHDPVLFPVARSLDLVVEPYYIDGGFLCLHGDAVPEPSLLEGIHTLVMGHEHPAVALSNGVRSEVYKCFLVLPYERRTLIVLPSTFALTHGFDVLANEPRNPLLAAVSKAEVYAVEDGTIVPCGSVAKLRQVMPKSTR